MRGTKKDDGSKSVKQWHPPLTTAASGSCEQRPVVSMTAWDSSDVVHSHTLNPAWRQELHGSMRSMQETLVNEFASKVDVCQQHFDEHVSAVRHLLEEGKQQQNLILQCVQELRAGPTMSASTTTASRNSAASSRTLNLPQLRSRGSSDSLRRGPGTDGRGPQRKPSANLLRPSSSSNNILAIPPIHEPLALSDSAPLDDVMPNNNFPLPGQAQEPSEVETEQEEQSVIPRVLSQVSTVEAHISKEKHRKEWNRHMQQTATQFLDRHKKLAACESTAIEIPGYPSFFLRVVEHVSFQWFCTVVIISTAFFEGYMADVGIRMSLVSPEQRDPSWFMPVATLLTTLYSIEVGCRLAAYCKIFFTGPDKFWNMFDLILVLLSSFEYMQFYSGIGSVSFIRGLRLLRVLRVIRVFSLFRDLRLMVCMISQSLWSLFWALLLLALILYLFTVIILQSLIFQLRNTPAYAADPAFMANVTNLYGSVWDSFFTLLGSITGGIDWIDATKCLREIGSAFRVLFCCFIFFTVIGVLNVLTGVFVERASELCGLDRDLVIQSQLRRNQTFLVEMTKLFKEANVSNTGALSWHEFRDYLQDERVQAFFAARQLDSFDARTLFDVLNSGGDDKISMDEFIVGCQRLKGEARSVELIAVLNETRSINKKLRQVLYGGGPRSNTADLSSFCSRSYTPCSITPMTSPM